MNHPIQLLVKFIYTSLILYLILGWGYHVPSTYILLTSVLVTVLGYAFDVFFLHRMGNVFATISDLLLTFTVVWAVGTYTFDTDIGTQVYKIHHVPLFQISSLIAVLHAVCEWFFHRWVHANSGQPEMFEK